MFSPKNKAAEVHIRFSSSGVLHQEDGPPEYLTLKASGAYFQRRQWQPTPVLMPGISHGRRSLVGFSPWGREESRLSDFTFIFHFHVLEKEMATHSSVLAWRIPGMEEPGGLPSIGSRRVRHD